MLTLLVLSLLLGIVTVARAQSQSDAEYARRDLEANYPNVDDRQYVFYVTTAPWTGYDAKQLKRAIKLAIASDSIQPVIELCAGVDIGRGLLRYDLRNLKWRLKDWNIVAGERNPYSPSKYAPLVVRADWLLVELSDLVESDSYNRLIFGGDNLPKTRDDIFKFFHVGNDPQYNYGLIEGKSGVSLQGTRRIEFRPSFNPFAVRTEDVLKLTNEKDALEHPGGGSPFDAEEGIIGLEKHSSTSGQRGLLHWYYLCDGKGNVISSADPRIVADATNFRNIHAITNPGSCIQCHAEGLKNTNDNVFAGLIKGGVNVFANEHNRNELLAALTSDVKKPIGRAQDDFQTIVQLVCSTPTDTVYDPTTVGAVAFKDSVNRYDAPLSLQRQAAELDATVVEWTRVLARNGTLPARLAASVATIPLPNGKTEFGTVPRAAWEQDFNQAYEAVHGGGLIKQAKPPEKPKAKPQQTYRRKAA